MTVDKKKVLEEIIRRNQREAYRNDFKSFAEDNIKIITKNVSQGFVPFEFNDAQNLINEKIEEQRAKTGRVRAIILKARQQGISTYCAARVFWKTYYTQYSRSVVMAHDLATSDALLDMSRNLMSRLDDNMKLKFSTSNKKEIKFEHNDSQYRLYTANSPEAGRGTTPTIAHLSEVAFWQQDAKILAGLFQGISQEEGTEVILESTANGADGEFHRLFWDAYNGENDYIAIFIPWFMTQEYTNENYPETFELDAKEKDLQEKFNLTDGQLYWRRLKIAESGPDKFKQEYPATPEEAFLTSGSYVFDQEKLNLIIPSKPKLVQEYNSETRYFEENPHGKLQVWVPSNFDDLYVIGADVALGVGQDHSAAIVMNPRGEICALYRDNGIDPSSYADVLHDLGRHYNNALLAVESNSIGLATLNRLEQLKYINLYYEARKEILSREEGKSPGFRMTTRSKPQVIGFLKRAIAEEDLLIPSQILLRELRTYIAKDNGATEALAGHNDDTVVALAIALEVLRTHADRLTNDRVPWKQRTPIQQEETTWL